MYFCMYMFCLRSGMFFAAAIEKKTDRAIPEQQNENRQQKTEQKSTIYYRKRVRFECEKIV